MTHRRRSARLDLVLKYGHIRGHENRRILAAADELGLSQSQLNDNVNARHSFSRLKTLHETPVMLVGCQG